MEKDKSIIDTIYAEYNSFFEAEKKIADYILKYGFDYELKMIR